MRKQAEERRIQQELRTKNIQAIEEEKDNQSQESQDEINEKINMDELV